MKKYILAMLLLNSSLVMADGPYDGIWSSQAGYFALHENAGTIIAVRLLSDQSTWEAFIAPRDGNSFTLESLISDVSIVIDITMTSDTTFSAIQVSCAPTYLCDFPSGTRFSGNKVW